MREATARTARRVGILGLVSATLLLPRSGWSDQNPATPPAAPPAASSTRAAAPAGDVDKGRLLYHRYGCWQCHGGEAQGGYAGPRLGPSPLPFPAFVRYVRSPRGEMPPYSIKLGPSERELTDIHAFLAARLGPAPVPISPP